MLCISMWHGLRHEANKEILFHCGMVTDGELSIIFCNCLDMVNDMKLTWASG